MLRLSIPERGRDLMPACRPYKGCDLCLNINGCEAGAREGVVEVDGTIIRSAPSRKETRLPGAEGDGFDGCAVDPFVLLTAFTNAENAVLARNRAEYEGIADAALGQTDRRSLYEVIAVAEDATESLVESF